MIKYCYYNADGKPTSEVMTAAEFNKIEKLHTDAWIDSTNSVMFENGKEIWRGGINKLQEIK